MNQKQIAQYGLSKAILEFMNNKKEVWMPWRLIVEIMAELEASNEAIKKNQETKSNTDSTGMTDQKNLALNDMVSIGFEVAQKLRLYAQKSQDMVLFKLVDYSESKFSTGPELELENRCTMVLTQARANFEKLADYNFPKERLELLAKSIGTYIPLKPKRDVEEKKSVNDTSALAELMTSNKAVMDSLDDHVDTIIADKEFLNAYHAVRKPKRH
jgi:hypothetical protein